MKHRLTLLLAPKYAKNLYFHDFPRQMYRATRAKTRYFVPRYVAALWSRLMTSTVENGRNNLLLSFTVIKSSLNAELTLKNIDFCDFQLR